MKKLWETGRRLDAAVEEYTVGDDPALDLELLTYEVYGSLAHAAGLRKIGILSDKELSSVRAAFRDLWKKRRTFTIARAQEDVHTAVEQHLTRKLGATGAKIHTGRSRNDQVQVDLRLMLMDKLLALHEHSCLAAEAWSEFGGEWDTTPLPGYTHLQRAMPSTVGHWAASHAEALLENARALRWAFEEADALPLGSAAGYGVPLPLDRALVAKLLGFSRVQRNTLRVQTSRPRIEAAAVSALSLLARDLGVLAWDLSLYTTAEFGFLSLDRSFTTGSSLMPQKKNPDVVELTRARAALFPGWLHQILALGQLPSGYHRDYQLTKGPLLSALRTASRMLGVAERLPSSLTVDPVRCREAVTEDMLATHKTITLVKTGLPFREAYRRVADTARAAGPLRSAATIEWPDYPGAPGNPDWDAVTKDRLALEEWNLSQRRRLQNCWDALLS